MTNEQKAKITELRHNGVSYASIASALGISKETVKSFCRRNSLTIEKLITVVIAESPSYRIRKRAKRYSVPQIAVLIGGRRIRSRL